MRPLGAQLHHGNMPKQERASIDHIVRVAMGFASYSDEAVKESPGSVVLSASAMSVPRLALAEPPPPPHYPLSDSTRL